MESKATLDVIESKAKYFFENSKRVHIILKKRGIFYNGTISEVKSDFFMFKDDLLDIIPVFYAEIWEIEPYVGR